MAKIYWDKGHGGVDSGIAANGMMEKNLVHTIVEYAMAYMRANYTGFEQKTSRVGDTYPTLDGRCNDANAWGADVFVSVHINGGGGTGYESYVYSRTDAATNSLQDKLNAEILAANVPYGKKAHGGEPIKINPTLRVLNGTHMPAVLTENLYLDSSDAETLRNDAYLKAIGEAHARGVAAHLRLNKIAPTEKYVYFRTGGFTNGGAIESMLNFLRDKKFGTWMEIDNYNLVFNVGDFTVGGENYNVIKKYFADNNIWAQEISR